MIYLDYSATTKTSDEVLDSFVKASRDFVGNPNSLHKLGVESNKLIKSATKQISNILNVREDEIIYTSGASEANNLAIKGIALKYKNRGKHIITTPLEHSSIYGPINYLIDNGFEVSFVKLDNFGRVDLDDLKNIIRDDTILVSINLVNSELGIMQPIDEISKIVKSHPKCFLHSDMTQAIGKIKCDLSNVDLVSFSAHKFFGIKGIGVLVKKDKILLEPLIHGGKSTTVFRSGTPTLPLIVSLAKALRIAYTNIDEKYDKVMDLNNYLKGMLNNYDKVFINSNKYSIPHILNISVIGVKPETMLHALENYDIYISTQSACSSSNTASKAVFAVTHDESRAKSSIRISLSYITTKDEIDYFLKCFNKCYEELTCLN